MIVLGIDPGLSGGIAWIDSKEGTANAIVMPILNNRPDLVRISGLVLDVKPDLAVIERPGNRPGQSAQSGMTAGINWGLIVGLLTERGIPIEEVSPRTWKLAMGCAMDSRATTKEKKERSIGRALQLFPTVDLLPSPKCRVYHDGMAESLLIASFGMRLGR